MKIKYKISLLFFILSISFCLGQQRYGNEWINFNQLYYKLSVVKDGMYRLSYIDLIQAGIPITSIDPRNIQIWRRGEEQSIAIEGQIDGKFDATDYIEFYGKKNDALLEQDLYREGITPFNPYLSMYSDTSAYFLTWSLTNEQGKRISTTQTTNFSTQISNHQNVLIQQFTEAYTTGRSPYQDIFRSYIDEGEGWLSGGATIGKPKNYTLFLPNSQAGKASIEIILVGVNSNQHKAILTINGQSITVPDFKARESQKIETSIDITSGNPSISLKLDVFGVAEKSDGVSIAYVKISYPQKTNFSGSQKYYAFTNNDFQKKIAFTNFSGVKLYNVSDEKNIQLISLNADNLGIISTKYLAVKDYYKVPKFEQVSFQQENTSSDYLLVTHKDFTNALQDYVNYRQSADGGNYQVSLAEMNRLINQYNYGEYSPLAIRHYCDYMIQNANAKYLFLVGKGLDVSYRESSLYYRFTKHDTLVSGNPLFSIQNYVPSFGIPGSDILYTLGLGDNKLVPALATGRITASSKEEIRAYFNKVKEHEALGFTELWRKNILHLSGGYGDNQPTQLLGYVNFYKSIAEDTLLGGKVETLTKKTTDEVEFYNISGPVNEGISLLTFFGHSAVRSIDVDFGNASDLLNGYQNKGKYPCLFINGCHAGEVFASKQYTRAEDWLFTPDKGAVTAFAHTSYGFSSLLHQYSVAFYRTAFQNKQYFGQSLGLIQQETIRKFYSTAGSNELTTTQANQFILLGDPAVALFPAQKADYEIKNSNVSLHTFANQQLTALTDSFQLHIPITNYGKAISDSFDVCITRKFANGQKVINYPSYKVKVVPYQDTLKITLYSEGAISAGQNTFEIHVDCNDKVPEYDEFNNFAQTTILFPLNSVFPLLPKEFTLLGTESVNFTAQSYDLFISENTEYLFQLDTNYQFKLPFITIEKTSGAFPNWKNIQLPILKDSTVYYWRVRLKTSDLADELAWQNSSFMYIKNKEGWAQGDFDQFRKDQKTAIYQNFNSEKWGFDTTQIEVKISSAGNQVNEYWKSSSIIVEGKPIVRGGYSEDFCVSTGVFVLPFDVETGYPYRPESITNGACGPEPRLAMSYVLNNSTNQQKLIDYIDLIKSKDYILITASGDGQYTSWNFALKNKLKEMGATKVDDLLFKTGHPYMLLFQKSTGKVLIEEIGLSTTDILEKVITITGRKQKGVIQSTTIGPAVEWNTYYHSFNKTSLKETKVELYGQKFDGTEELLYTYLANGESRDSISLKTTDANVYPFMVLKSYVSDSISGEIPQLNNWLITYQGVPEGVMNPSLIGGIENYLIDAVQEGDSILLKFAFENISQLDFKDTLTVRYTINNQTSSKSIKEEIKLNSLKSGEQLFFEKKISTLGFVGQNTIEAYVNPRYLAEEYYDNNFLKTSFEVQKDDKHPVLEVLFDGLHILDGEIVSPSPYITINLHDENTLLFKQDTTDIELFLKKPCLDGQQNCEYEKIFFTNPDIIQWTPATAKQSFKIEYNPKNLEDGIYTLRVQGVDASGNKSSVQFYEIHFQVINESTITHFLPYPNPFSTQTRFVFTLTGSEIPDQIKIQIMTISGKIVREITQDELGPIRIGNNISDYAWNGRDEFGDLLANGVYLYRVILKSNGEDIKHRDTSVDKAFKKDFGKIYILR